MEVAMAHYIEYQLEEADDGKEVLFLMQKVLGLTTKKVRSVKHEERGILLDGERVTVRAKGKAGQFLKVMLEDSQEKQNKVASTKMNLHILYEDEDLLFIDKPTGIVSHPSKGHSRDSIINGVQAYFEEKYYQSGERNNIHLIGRLDKETSGVLGIAKNSVTAERLIRQRKEGILVKEYLALVKGNPPKKGTLEIPMEEMRDTQAGEKLKMKAGTGKNAKTAKTFFHVVKRFENFSLVSLVIETGRTHQIRFHMEQIGCPLLGDSFYGDGPELGISRTALHAWRVTLTHPFCKNVMTIESEMPKDLSFLLR